MIIREYKPEDKNSLKEFLEMQLDELYPFDLFGRKRKKE